MSDQPKHTPGPWVFEVAPYGHGFQLSVRAPGTLVGHQADTVLRLTSAKDSRAEKTANGRLIAAAPELLAALEQLVQWSDEKCDRAEAIDDDLMLAARAALAKAKGEK